MMKRTLPLSLITSLASIILVLGYTPSVLADDGDTPQIALRVLQASPAATIEVEGGRFEPDALVRFVLVQSLTQTPLGTAFADDHGEFIASVFLPLELQPGQYEFQAIDEKNRRAVAPLTIVQDVSGEQGNGQRENEDPLFAPMPTFVFDVESGNAPEATSGVVSVSNYSGSYFYWILIALIGLLLGAAILIRQRRKGS